MDYKNTETHIIEATKEFAIINNIHYDELTESMILNAMRELKKYLTSTVSNCADLKQELEVTDKLLNERQRVLDAIPECKSHGKCVPHAIEWIEEMKAKHCC